MTLSIANTSSGNGDFSGSTATCAITRSAGESLLFGYFYEYDYGNPDPISSVVWDPTGDNQSMTLIDIQTASYSGGGNFKRLAVYYLAAPTSAKSGNIVVTHSGTILTRYIFICRRIIDANLSSFYSSSAKRYEPSPFTNDLSIDLTSATGELGVGFFFYRNQLAYVAPGPNLNDYVEQGGTSSSRTLASGSRAGAATCTLTADIWDTEYENAIIAVSVKPAGASGAMPLTNRLITMNGGMIDLT